MSGSPFHRRRFSFAALYAPLLGVVVLALAGCARPIGADRTSVRHAYHQFAANAVEGHLSDTSRIVLHRYNLEDEFRRDPASALRKLHERACVDERRDVLFALAGLNFHHAGRLARSVAPGEARKAPDFYLASAIYAWMYLLGDGAEPPPGPFDRRFRNACDFYNYGAALGFSRGARTNTVIEPAGGTRALVPGRVDVELFRAAFKWDLSEFTAFLPADEFHVRGLSVRDRQSGLGAPLIAVGKVLDERQFTRRVPTTMILRVPGSVRDWSEGRLRVALELYSSYDVAEIDVGGRKIPLEADFTAPLAHGLNESFVWSIGNSQFFSAEEKVRSKIYFTQPYAPGKIPVVFVHGTASSPVWWAEMWNTLRTDPTLRERYQFWNFVYNTGNPVANSAARLRAEIDRKIRQLDPEGRDPALREMVVIGHSQGGLLTGLAVTDSGDKLWKAVSEKEFDSLSLPPEEKEEVRKRYFFTPVPSVKRVIFIATPHRGSFLATSLVRNVMIRFMKLPEEVVRSSARLLTLQNPLGLKPGYERRVPSSLDDMSPNNPWLRALADLPTAPGVSAHSIVALRGNAKPPVGGDGVVKYTSAHIDYAKSEFVVQSSHSCQDKPEVIEEVRRVLIEHLNGLPPVR